MHHMRGIEAAINHRLLSLGRFRLSLRAIIRCRRPIKPGQKPRSNLRRNDMGPSPLSVDRRDRLIFQHELLFDWLAPQTIQYIDFAAQLDRENGVEHSTVPIFDDDDSELLRGEPELQ